MPAPSVDQAPSPAMNLTARAHELAADAERQRDELEERRQALLGEREAEVAKVREQYRARLDEIEAELSLVERLRKALDPEGVKAERAAKKRTPAPAEGKPAQWRPRDVNFVHVLTALQVEGVETVAEIADRTPISHATVKVVLDHARAEGTVRLAGTVKRGTTPTKAYRITPAGEAWLADQASQNGAGVGTDT